MKKIQSKMKPPEWSQHYISFFRRSRAASCVVGNVIWSKFELIQAFILVLVTRKNEEDPFEKEGTKAGATFLTLYGYGDFSRLSKTANSTVPGRILPNFELLQDVLVVLITYKNE